MEAELFYICAFGGCSLDRLINTVQYKEMAERGTMAKAEPRGRSRNGRLQRPSEVRNRMAVVLPVQIAVGVALSFYGRAGLSCHME